MINTLNAWTDEIDDVDVAVEEILTKLGMETSGKSPFLKNSVGIVSCYSDFVDSGVVAALAERLPFPLAGITTLACATAYMMGPAYLALTVLSSDDVEFVVGVSESISSADEALLRAAYEAAAAKREGKPVCMISFAPLLMNVASDFFIKAFDNITGGVPNFGTLAVDHTSDYHKARTLMGGAAFSASYVFILLYGNVKPSFFVASISEEKAFREKGVITAANGNNLQSVNNMPVVDYLAGLGLQKDAKGNIIGINSFPFILDYNDGTQPIVRVMFAFASDGSAVCGGDMPLGATLSVGKIDAEDVLATTEKVLRKALQKNPSASGILIFSCVGRYFAQGYESTQEMEKVREILGSRPWHLVYSGGELCPVLGRDGRLVNRSHNDTFVICLF
jgi:hypothetical protein